MSSDLWDRVQARVGARIQQKRRVSGGDINEAWWLETADGACFVKTHPDIDRLPGMFFAEAAGLEALRDHVGDALRVPQVVTAEHDFIVMEAIEFARPSDDFEQELGRGLAYLHRHSPMDRFGFLGDNYLGATPQDNTWHDTWIGFWRERRLRPMLEGLASYPDVQTLGRRLDERLEKLLDAPEEPACLIHGDLWSGNAAPDTAGRPCLFDPACCFAHREFEFGLTRLFGFGTRFEAAYQEAWPLAEGWESRVEVYKLYHLMNHLFLFGGTYHALCVRLLNQVLRSAG